MTMTKEKKINSICNIICAVLVAVLLVTFFVLPFWSYTAKTTSAITDKTVVEDRTISLGDYVWFTRDHKDLFGTWRNHKTKGVVDGNLKDFNGNWFFQTELTEMPFLSTLFGVAAMIFCVWKRQKAWVGLFAAASAGCMLFGLLTSPVLQTGQSWLYLVIVSGVALAGTLPAVVRWLINVFKWFTVKKRHY